MGDDIPAGSSVTLLASNLVANAHDMPTVKANSKQASDLCINKIGCEIS